jgi:Zn finger protein HypA/HybF involved in hydrogenase expression
MTHEDPYAGPNTLMPGEVADDDPFSAKEYCPNCDEGVEPTPGTGECPTCGTEIK